MRGGDSAEVILSPKGTASLDFKLPRALYVAGIVVNSNGKGIPGVKITAIIIEPGSYAYVTRLLSRPDGKFEIFDFPPADFRKGRGLVVFEHRCLRRTKIENVYMLPKVEREELRVVMESGTMVKGRILSQQGQPVSGVMVEARFDEPNERKAVITEDNGKFVLRGLPEAKCTLVAHDRERQQKVKDVLVLKKDYEDLQLQLKPLPPMKTGPSVHVLGMELIDLNNKLSDVYDLPRETGVLVLDPGNTHARLKIESLAKGDCFWLVGDAQITSVREFVHELLRNVQRRHDGSGSCRVVYFFRRVDSTGTSTQFIELTSDDLKELERIRDRLDTPQRQSRN